MTIRLVSSKSTTVARVRNHLENALNSGRFPPGAKLPTERTLSLELEVPRNAVREALAVLETAGKVMRAAGSGTFVCDPAGAEQAIEPGFQGLGILLDASPKEIMEARFVFEPRLALLVVNNATAADFGRLEHLLSEGEAAQSFTSFEAADNAFHQAIAEATHNRLIVELYAAIGSARHRAAWGGLRQRFLTAERRVESCREHRAIFAGLATRNASQAESAILTHLNEINAALFKGHSITSGFHVAKPEAE